MAIVMTLFDKQIVSFTWIIIGLAIGSLIGALFAYRVSLIHMPGMVALLNGFGGLASLLVGWFAYHVSPQTDALTALTIYLSVLIGGVTFTGSMIAWAKLQEVISGKPFMFFGQKVVNGLLLLVLLIGGFMYITDSGTIPELFYGLIILSLLLGIFSIIPIGGADMPVVISLLNSYSGMAACATGFVINNTILIITGALVGASGIILTRVMCKGMNRSLSNVLFSGFGSAASSSGSSKAQGTTKPISAEDTYALLEASRSVVIVPGYGMAVAQAQHVIRELQTLLEKNGTEVRFAIHPVAGRMPGHMNVLLAEANVPYDTLFEMDAINPTMDTVDVAIVIGANDVVNPAAKEEKSSPLYGMPIINVDKARTVIVLKRSMASGFSGAENPLFYKENTRMLFGDAKESVQAVVAEFKSS
jgi:H+-translocating NAD(P) transhydrogenase subunit beta